MTSIPFFFVRSSKKKEEESIFRDSSFGVLKSFVRNSQNSWFPIISFAQRCCRGVQNFLLMNKQCEKIFFSQRIAKKPLFVRRQSFLCFTTRINNNNNNTLVYSRARS